MKKRRIFILLAVLMVIVFGGQAYRLSQIKSVRVVGNKVLARSEVLALAGIETGANWFEINPKRIEARLTEYWLIKEACVKKSWPNDVLISISERETAALISFNDSFLRVDADGYVLGMDTSLKDAMSPIITGLNLNGVRVGETLPEMPKVTLVLEALTVMDKLLRARLSEITVVDESTLDLYTLRGVHIRIEGRMTVERMQALKGVLDDLIRRDEVGFIDMSVEGQIIFRPE